VKIITVPDPHGQEHWKKARKLIDEVDKIVFLGDYWDHWTTGYNRQLSNFIQILKFKKKHPDKVVLLWGNHDTSYYLDERCSGHQPGVAFDIYQMLKVHNNLFDVIFIADKWIFVHGGVSKDWMRHAGMKDPSEINQMFKERSGYFKWVGPDGYGNNQFEGPLWIRPGALRKYALDGYNFAVGHSEINTDNATPPVKLEHNNGGFILLSDCPKHNCLVKIDTETNEYERVNIK